MSDNPDSTHRRSAPTTAAVAPDPGAFATPLAVGLTTASLIRPLTGIGQYTLNVALAVAQYSDLRMHYFYGYEWSDEVAPRSAPQVDFAKRWLRRLTPRPYEIGRAFQQNRFSAGLAAHHFDVYHETNFLPFEFDGPLVLTIHDLSYLRYPETHPELRVRIMNKLLPPAIERAAHLLADSEFTRQEVIQEFGVSPDRITTTLLGVSEQFRPRSPAECEAVLQRHGLRYGGFVLAVGTLEPRKNLVQVIRAYGGLPNAIAQRHPLVVVGGKGWKFNDTKNEFAGLLADGRAKHLGFVPEEDLPILYSAARLFVFPSLYEGFGLPAAEAMASGVPVIVSNRASLPEVVGEAGIAIAPGDVDAMREAIRHLVEDDEAHAVRSTLGIARARQFSWARCGELTAQAYRRAAGRA